MKLPTRQQLPAVADRRMMLAMTALTVLALHLLFGLSIALHPARRSPAAEHGPLFLLPDLPHSVILESTSNVNLDLSVQAPRPPRPALPAPADPTGAIVDTAQSDSIQVERVCGSASQHGRREDIERETSVLVLVDQDGRITDSHLLASSGSAERDAALLHCLLTRVRLTPLQFEGHAVAAWQRFQPRDSQSFRRP